MPQRLSVYPDLAMAEFGPLLEADLAHRGRGVLQRIVHGDGEVHRRLSQRLGRHADSVEAPTFHLPAAADGLLLPPSVVMHHRPGCGGDGREGRPAESPLPPARALSQAAGGRALAIAAGRDTERHAVGAFHAGRTVEASVSDGPTAMLQPGAEPAGRADITGGATAWSSFSALHRAVAFGQAADLHRASAQVPPRSWIVSTAPPGDDRLAALGRGEAGLRRAVFVDACAARCRKHGRRPAGRPATPRPGCA